MLEQFVGQLLETIGDKRVSSVIVNYYDGESSKQAVFSSLEIEKNVRRNGWQVLIDGRLEGTRTG